MAAMSAHDPCVPTTAVAPTPSPFSNQLPSGVSKNISNTPLSDDQKERLRKAKEFARQVTLKLCPLTTVINTVTPGLQFPPPATILCRAYIGSINFEINDQDIKAVCTQFGGVRSVSMSIDSQTMKHKGFCFVEFDTPDAASLALECLNLFNLGGRSLKVGRPNNYSPQIFQDLPKSLPSRLYIANVSEYIAEDMLQNIFAPFGEIKGVALIPDIHTRNHKGYGYIEYENEQHAQAALMSLDNLELGGLKLHVRKALIDTPFPEGMAILEKIPSTSLPSSVLNAAQAINDSIPAAPKITIEAINSRISSSATLSASHRGLGYSHSSNGNSTSLASEENLSVSGSQRYEIMQKLAQRTNLTGPLEKEMKTAVLLLKNVVSPEEVDESLKGEIEEEVSKYGMVKDVVVFVDTENGDGAGDVGKTGEDRVKIFVEFNSIEACEKGRVALNNRWFAGRQISAIPFNEKKFREGRYSE